MKNIFEIFRNKEKEEKPDYGSLQGLKPDEGQILRILPSTRTVVSTRRGMGQVEKVWPGKIVEGKNNG